MLSSFTTDALSGVVLSTVETALIGRTPYHITVRFEPDTDNRCVRAALALLDGSPRWRIGIKLSIDSHHQRS